MAKFDSPAIVKRQLQPEFGQKTSREDCITRTFQRFCETGTVEDRPRSGRPQKITEEKIDEVYDVCATERHTSVRAVATACSISRPIAYRITTEYLSLKPYKVHFFQKLYEEDFQGRGELCRILLTMLLDPKIQENVFFSDEATFYVNEFVNKHNIRYGCETDPHDTLETVMKSPKLNV